MDYYNDCLKREECYECQRKPRQFKMDYFRKCHDKIKCDSCIQTPPTHYFNQMPSSCGPPPEFSCMKTADMCPQHNGSDFEWIFSVPDKYNALMGLRNILYPDNCFEDDMY